MKIENDIPLREQICPQMRPYIGSVADGSLRGFLAWYAQNHIARCPQCTSALESLRDLRKRLSLLG